MIFGGKMATSSNHQALLDELGLIDSGVFLYEEEGLNPDAVSGEEDVEDDAAMRLLISEFWAILANRAQMSLSSRPDESA